MTRGYDSYSGGTPRPGTGQALGVDPVVSTAVALADGVLFPRALDTDGSGVLPTANLDTLADAGFYGLFAPPDLGGLGADLPTMCEVVETLASGCLTTSLVWMQHFGLLGNLLRTTASLRDEWLPAACRGERRGGIAFGGLLPGPPVLTATPRTGGWVLAGVAPWVSGWGGIDVLLVAARGPDDTVVNVGLDAREGGGLRATPLALTAVDASSTVRLDFAAVEVSEDRVLAVDPYDPDASLGTSLRLNGSLALGVARRCCDLLGPSPLDAELRTRRRALDEADRDGMAAERAVASAFALRAAAGLVVHVGSRAVGRDQDAQRLLREATFLLVFGSRPAIKKELLAQLVGVPT